MPLKHANDQTAMSRQQLAERIRQMEATQAREDLGEKGPRWRPGETILRREKIAAYKAELQRREDADRAQAAEDARVEQRAKEQSARDTRRNLRAMGVCHADGCTDWAISLDHLCARHGAAAAAKRYAIGQTPTPDTPPKEQPDMRRYTDWKDQPPNPDQEAEREKALQAEEERRQERQFQARRCADSQAEATEVPPPPAEALTQAVAASTARAQTVAAIRQTVTTAMPEHTHHTPPPVISPPPDPRIGTPCPQCHAEIGTRCRNYKGVACNPHTSRKAPICFADGCISRAAVLNPKPLCARHANGQTEPAPKPAIAAGPVKTPDPPKTPTPAPAPVMPMPTAAPAPVKHQADAELTEALTGLLRRYTLGTILEAAWDVDRELWEAEKARRAADAAATAERLAQRARA